MRWLPVLACLLCVGGPASAAQRTPFQARCEDSLRKTATQLTARQPSYRVDNSLSYRALTIMKGQSPARTYVLGLTRTEAHVAVRSSGSILSDPPSGYECIAARIDVELWYTPIVVYVGREFGPGTCAYDNILAHELRHVRTYLDHLPIVERTVRKTLDDRFGDRPLYAPSGQSNALLGQEIDSRWLPYIKSEMGKVEIRQAAIDTPAEYIRLSRICKGEVPSSLKAHQR
jgi:hypothetical protein